MKNHETVRVLLLILLALPSFSAQTAALLHFSAQTAARTDGPRWNINAVRQCLGLVKNRASARNFTRSSEGSSGLSPTKDIRDPQVAEFTERLVASGRALKLHKKTRA